MHLYGVLASMKRKKGVPAHRQGFGAVVRHRRDVLGLSQEKLAEAVGCHRNYLGRIERGEQNITLDMMARVAKALKCGVFDLVKDAGI